MAQTDFFKLNRKDLIMKTFAFLFLFAAVSSIATAQADDCDPNNVVSNSWFEGKRKEFGPNCLQLAVNKIMSLNYGGMVNISLGGGANKTVPTIDPFEKVTCNLPGGCWKTTLRNMYRSIATYHDETYRPIYSRPLFVENFGSKIVLTTYSTEIDTTWLKYDDAEIMKYIPEQFDAPDEDELEVTLAKYAEDGKVYYKLVGIITPSKEPIEVSTLAELMYAFCSGWTFHLIQRLNDIEINYCWSLKYIKHPYFKRKEMEGLLGLGNFSAKGSAKEGSWSFTKMQGKKSCWIDNDGDKLTLYLRINADEKILAKVAEKMEAWVKKNPFDNGISTEIQKSPKQYWVKTVCKIGDVKGDEIREDYYDEFFNDYGDEVIDEVEDIVDDLN